MDKFKIVYTEEYRIDNKKCINFMEMIIFDP
jgi:hypothetical protein